MKTTIEINGRKYDARTGKLLESTSDMGQQKTQQVASSGSIDGFSKHKPVANINNMPSKPVNVPQSNTNHSHSTHKSLDILPAARKTQKAKTLARSAVKKPVKQGPQLHATSGITDSNLEKSASGRGVLLKRVPGGRLERAKNTTKSAFINRFDRSSKIKPELSPNLNLQPEPIVNSQEAATPVFGKKHSNNKNQVFNHPNVNYDTNSHDNTKKVGFIKKFTSNFSISGKLVAISAAVAAIVLLGGFFMYQNVPSVGMRIAASKAGFNGKFPGSTPSGYAFKGPIVASKGNIVLNYQSNTDERKFALSQKPTSWTSESLLTNYLVDSKLRYQTYQDKGMTVYIYNESNATWVDKGIWYTVKGDGSLSSEQILEIASSI